MAQVQGEVHLDGKPLSTAYIYFVATQGPQVMGTVEEGSFQLISSVNERDIQPGTYRIFFAPAISDAEEREKMSRTEAQFVVGAEAVTLPTSVDTQIPSKYLSMHTTDLSREVSQGENNFVIELKSN